MLAGAIDEIFTRTDSTGTANFLTDALGSTLALIAYDVFGRDLLICPQSPRTRSRDTGAFLQAGC